MILQITNPSRGQLFYIDEMGRMPALRFEACLLDEQNQAVKTPMQWSLQIIDNVWPGFCPSAKVGRQVIHLHGSSAGLGVWIPAFNANFGGDAELSVSADYAGESFQASVNFRIRGKNPSAAAVVECMGGERAPLTHLARFLSALRQFDIQGMPSLDEHGAVGIVRLCDPAARPHQRWNWMQNVQAGRDRLLRLEGISKAYLDKHRVDDRYANNKSLNDNQVLLREMMQRFLGGAYWQWDEQAAQWRSEPPDDSVEKILHP